MSPRALLAAAVGAALASALPRAISHDQAMYVYIGDRILHGARPYLDVIELNFPTIMYVSTIPAALHRAGLGVDLAFALFVWLCLCVCAGLLAAIVGGARGTLAGAVFLVTMSVVSERSFGQREHLFVMAWLPYLALKAVRAQEARRPPPALAFAAGLLAGLGLCLKPHFLPFLVLAELPSLRRQARVRTPELAGVVTAGVAFVAHFAILGPAYARAFWTWSVAPGLGGYSAFNVPWQRLVDAVLPAALIYPPLVAALAAWGDLSAWARHLLRACVTMGVAGVALYLLQRKGIDHYLLVAWLPLGFGAAVALVEALRDRARGGQLTAAVALVVVVGIAWTPARSSVATTARAVTGRTRENAIAAFLKTSTPAGQPVLFISTALHGQFPALWLADRVQGARLLWLYTLPDALIHGKTDAASALVGMMTDDARASRPSVILMSREAYVPDGAGVLARVFLGDPRFARLIAEQYRAETAPLVAGEGELTYTIFRRRD